MAVRLSIELQCLSIVVHRWRDDRCIDDSIAPFTFSGHDCQLIARNCDRHASAYLAHDISEIAHHVMNLIR